METPNFWGEVYFCQQNFSLDGREKSHRGLDQGNRVNVLEHNPLFFPKTMPHFRPCDLRHCHVTNKYHICLSLVIISGRILQIF